MLTAANSLTLADGSAHPTGVWAEELVVAHRELKAAGVEIVLTTPGGAPSPVDPGSLTVDGGDEFAAYLATISGELQHPADPASQNAADFDAIVIPGGQGPMADLATDADAGALLIAALEAGLVIAPFCHGPAALLSAVRADSSFAFAGRRLAAFTDDEERTGGLGAGAPWLLSGTLAERGAVVEAGDAWSSHVVVDGRLVSGQNPQSSDAVAAQVLALLAD